MLADRYRLDGLLGEGGMGKVYAAEHVLMRKRLAVKILHRQLTQVPEVVRRFEREALAAGHIDHPNVAGATDFGKLSDGSVYLVLEFVEGQSLRDVIAEGPMPPADALHVARQIAAALTAAHELSIVHRDLKPENVMLVDKGTDTRFVKVLDFGIAKVPIGEDAGAGKPITKAGMVYGTPEYMAPEQALGQAVDGRADLYALGVILYEMLAGVRPFSGRSQSQVGLLGQQLTQSAPSFAERAPGLSIPSKVETLVMRLLAREADERYQSAAEVRVGLDALASEAGPGAVASAIEDGRARLSAGRARGVLGAPGVALLSPSDVPAEKVEERRRPLGVSGRAWAVASVGAAGLALGALLLASAAGDETPAELDTRSEDAQDSAVRLGSIEERLAHAEQQGASALEALAEGEPSEAAVFVALAAVRVKGGEFARALRAASRALALDPKLHENPRLASVLFRAAQSEEASAAAFRILQGPMGARGADIIYDLARTQGVRVAVKREAEALLRSSELHDRASPALRVAIGLREARTCAQRAALLERSKSVGDARALELLRPLAQTTGCGPNKSDDCNPCLRQDDQLARAIETIAKRSAPATDSAR